jgi:hypothetical protein
MRVVESRLDFPPVREEPDKMPVEALLDIDHLPADLLEMPDVRQTDAWKAADATPISFQRDLSAPDLTPQDIIINYSNYFGYGGGGGGGGGE